jgi:predicted SAM-dependent methyltransferase
LNTDRDPASGGAYIDASRRFPVADGVFDYCFAEHMIEHLTYERGRFMLEECHRVLRPGGRVRIATPDLDRIRALRDQDRDPEMDAYVKWSIDRFVPYADGYRAAFVANVLFRGWGHRFLYDESTLAASLEHAGFADVKRYAYGESDDPELRGIESHGASAEDREMIRYETLVLEAARP